MLQRQESYRISEADMPMQELGKTLVNRVDPASLSSNQEHAVEEIVSPQKQLEQILASHRGSAKLSKEEQ